MMAGQDGDSANNERKMLGMFPNSCWDNAGLTARLTQTVACPLVYLTNTVDCALGNKTSSTGNQPHN